MPKRFSDQIRSAINDCGVTRYRIAKETGIDESLLSRFVRGKCNISLRHIDTLAELLGFELKLRRRRKR